MQTITINKEDWTGESITVKIKKSGRFDLFGYEFQLKKEKIDDDIFFKVLGNSWEYPLVQGFFNEYDNTYIMFADEIKEGNLSREAACPFSAAIKVLCNII